MTENEPLTWRVIALAYPTHVQRYVQANGPLPDGPVTSEGWAAFAEGRIIPPDKN